MVGPKGAKMMPRAPKKVPTCPGSPKVKENEPRGTQRGTNEKKDDFLELFAHPFGRPF